MGITRLSLDRIDSYTKQPGKLLILGCQNLYDMEHYGQIAHPYFESLGFDVRSWDITGCQGSEVVDLRENLRLKAEYDFVFQHGTVEHIDGGLYQPFKNIHEALKIGGIVIHENPKTDNWPEHGYHYFTEKFYRQLCADCGYSLLALTEEPAMSNTTDGWNICAVIEKISDKFCGEDQFNTYELLPK
jgi:hypothetical protein